MDYVLGALSDKEKGNLWRGGSGLSGKHGENLDCFSSCCKLEVTERKGTDLAHYVSHVLKAYVLPAGL